MIRLLEILDQEALLATRQENEANKQHKDQPQLAGFGIGKWGAESNHRDAVTSRNRKSE